MFVWHLCISSAIPWISYIVKITSPFQINICQNCHPLFRLSHACPSYSHCFAGCSNSMQFLVLVLYSCALEFSCFSEIRCQSQWPMPWEGLPLVSLVSINVMILEWNIISALSAFWQGDRYRYTLFLLKISIQISHLYFFRG